MPESSWPDLCEPLHIAEQRQLLQVEQVFLALLQRRVCPNKS